MKVAELKDKYPIVYMVFWGGNADSNDSANGSLPASTKGYETFRQIGLELKERAKHSR